MISISLNLLICFFKVNLLINLQESKFSYEDVSKFASKIFATQCFFTEHLKHKTVIKQLAEHPHQSFANYMQISWTAFQLLSLFIYLFIYLFIHSFLRLLRFPNLNCLKQWKYFLSIVNSPNLICLRFSSVFKLNKTVSDYQMIFK